MTGIERTIAEFVALLIMCVGGYLYIEHRGAEKCEDKDKAAVTSQLARNAAIIQTDTQVINDEAKAHANALAAAPDPTPILECVRYYASPIVPKAPATQPPSHAPTALPTAVGPSFNPAPAVAKVGQAADAQVVELQSYIRDVCLGGK